MSVLSVAFFLKGESPRHPVLCEAARRSGNENGWHPLPFFQESLRSIHSQRVGAADHSKYLIDTLSRISSSRDNITPPLCYSNVLQDMFFFIKVFFFF